MLNLESIACTFWLKTDMKFGVGATRELPKITEQWGFKRLGLVVDAGVSNNSIVRELVNGLRELHELDVLENAVAEPDYDYLDEYKQQFTDKNLDCIIAVGGGSTLDLGKALSVLITNPGPAIQYRGFNLIKNPGPPLVAIPTTAGTGSEVTPNAVFTDKKEMRKLGINTQIYVPKLAILDPLMTASCPKSVTVSSGMDALVHTLESYVANFATPISRIFSREAFSLVFNTLPKVVDEPDNLEWRARMQLGAYYAGIALMNASSGPAGAMSYPLGVHFKVPHGIAGAVFLPHLVRYNVENGYLLYADLYDLIENAETGLDTKEKSAAFSDLLQQLYDKVGVPKTLDVFGVSRNDIPMLSEQFMGLKAAMGQNPVSFSTDNARDILEQMF